VEAVRVTRQVLSRVKSFIRSVEIIVVHNDMSGCFIAPLSAKIHCHVVVLSVFYVTMFVV
jgi:hypothetical protein